MLVKVKSNIVGLLSDADRYAENFLHLTVVHMECSTWGHSLVTICGDVCPFHASVLRPASQVGPMHNSTWGLVHIMCGYIGTI